MCVANGLSIFVLLQMAVNRRKFFAVAFLRPNLENGRVVSLSIRVIFVCVVPGSSFFVLTQFFSFRSRTNKIESRMKTNEPNEKSMKFWVKEFAWTSSLHRTAHIYLMPAPYADFFFIIFRVLPTHCVCARVCVRMVCVWLYVHVSSMESLIVKLV